MKKFFALVVCSFIALSVVVGATELSAKQKFETKSAISLASGAFMMRANRTGGSQSDYQKLKEEYPKNPVISRSYIRMEQYLVNGKGEYRFDHTRQSSDSLTEHKLADQDAFFVTDIGIFLMNESTATPGISVLQTYPNPIQFPDGAAGFLKNADLEHLYNGFFSIKIGDTTWLPDQPIFDCRVVNTTQQSALATNDSERHPGDGFIPCHPKPTLLGMENNELKLIVPANSLQKVETDSATVGFKTKVACILLGYKITGAGRNPGV